MEILCGTCRKADVKTYATQLAIVNHKEPDGWGDYTQFFYVCDPCLTACIDSLDVNKDKVTVKELVA